MTSPATRLPLVHGVGTFMGPRWSPFRSKLKAYPLCSVVSTVPDSKFLDLKRNAGYAGEPVIWGGSYDHIQEFRCRSRGRRSDLHGRGTTGDAAL